MTRNKLGASAGQVYKTRANHKTVNSIGMTHKESSATTVVRTVAFMHGFGGTELRRIRPCVKGRAMKIAAT